MDSLASWVAREGTLSEEHAVGWIVRLTKTLEPVHRLGLAHGRLSAEALRIGGLSCHEEGSLAAVAELADRVPYHSPERAVGGAPSPANDTWAAAVILYEALTGAHPFPARTDEELRLRLSGDLPRRLAHFGVDHYDLQHVLDRALAPTRAGRLLSLRELRVALVSLHPASGLLAPLDFGDDHGLVEGEDVEEKPRPSAPRARASDSGATSLGLGSIPASRRRKHSTSNADPFAPEGSDAGESSPGRQEPPDDEEETLVVSKESLGIAAALQSAAQPARRASERPAPPSSKRPLPPPSSKRPPPPPSSKRSSPPPSSKRPPPLPSSKRPPPPRHAAGDFDVDLEGLDDAGVQDRSKPSSRKLSALVDDTEEAVDAVAVDTEIRQAEAKKALEAVRARTQREPTKAAAPKKATTPRKRKRKRRLLHRLVQLILLALIVTGVLFALRPALLRRTEAWVHRVAIPKAEELLGLKPPPDKSAPEPSAPLAASSTAPPQVEVPSPSTTPSSSATGAPDGSAAASHDAGAPAAAPADAATADGPEPLRACVSALLLEDAFVGIEPDLGFLCTETHPQKGATALKVQIVRAGQRGAVTTAMQELSLLGWYEIAAFVVIRERCCDQPAALAMPETLDQCKLEQSMARVGTTGFEGDPATVDPALDEYMGSLQCLFRMGAGASYGLVRLTHAGSRSAFRKMLDRIRKTKTP